MSDIKVKPGTVEIRNTGVSILNVGEGDTKLTFDPGNPAERIRAARIVTDMLRRGYALLVENPPGSKQYVRVTSFDEAKCEYIIADLDPLQARDADEQDRTDDEHSESRTDDAAAQPPAEAGAGAPAPEAREDGRKSKGPATRAKMRLKAEGTRAVAIGRTAGG